MDLNILGLTYFLILKRRVLALFSLRERSLTWCCQVGFVSIFTPRYLTLSVETSRLSNPLKVCINEIGNIQVKVEKSWKSIEKYYSESFVFNYVLYIFSSSEGGFTCSPLFRFMVKPHTNDIRVTYEYILFFLLLLGMLFGVDKRVGFRHAINDEEDKFSFSGSLVKHRTP